MEEMNGLSVEYGEMVVSERLMAYHAVRWIDRNRCQSLMSAERITRGMDTLITH